MKTITVDLGKRSYQIVVGHRILDQLPCLLEKLRIGQDAVIVTNPNIHHLHAAQLHSILARHGFTTRFKLVPDSEQSKSQKVCFELINKIAAYDTKKRLFLVAFGGGVIGDLTGFIASIYKRGVPYINIPTTFLAQVDSAIGGKTGIDLDLGKNLVGSFYQPRLVLSDISFLMTLSLRQIRDGLAEAIKCAVIKDAQLFEYIEKKYKDILQLNIEALNRVICACSRIKSGVVEADETEKLGRRAILNFGHTIGHAVETASGYTKEYSHGEAISIGMACACDIARRLSLMGRGDAKRIEGLLSKVGLPVTCSGLKAADIMEAQSRDKKFIHGKNRFVLAKRIGCVIIKEDIPVKLIESVIKARVSG